MIQSLTPADRSRVLATLPNWTYDETRRAIHRRIVFATFADALAAMVRIGVRADRADHHPEWSNVYDRLDIWLTTHDADGVSERDVAMAQHIDALYPAA